MPIWQDLPSSTIVCCGLRWPESVPDITNPPRHCGILKGQAVQNTNSSASHPSDGGRRAGLWIRVSTEDQARGDSPEHHEVRGQMYAEMKGWTVVTVYHLEGVSGKSVMGHPEAKRMLADVRGGQISALIFSKSPAWLATPANSSTSPRSSGTTTPISSPSKSRLTPRLQVDGTSSGSWALSPSGRGRK